MWCGADGAYWCDEQRIRKLTDPHSVEHLGPERGCGMEGMGGEMSQFEAEVLSRLELIHHCLIVVAVAAFIHSFRIILNLFREGR